MADIKSETIALAALFQSCQQIQRIASTGYMDEHAVACVIRALLVTNPKSIEDIYAPGKLMSGFKQIVESFGASAYEKTAQSIEITKTAMKLVALEITIERNQSIFRRMGDEIDRLYQSIAVPHPEFLDSGSPETVLDMENLRQFSSLYQSLISPNFAKLMIYGEKQYLGSPENQTKIRALLLAGIRAVVLWRQLGGRRRLLIFRRKAIIEFAKRGAATGSL